MHLIATSLNLDTNEVQTITTSVEDVNEVQVITTSATPRGEVQCIDLSPIPGEVSLNDMLKYSLKLSTLMSGGSVEYSDQISATIKAEGDHESLQSILGSMKNLHSPPNVSKSETNADGGHTYCVTFPSSMKDVPEMEVYLSDFPVTIYTQEDANLLDGFFRLQYTNDVTDPISYDADEDEMQAALESLNSVGTVHVIRSDSDEQNGYSWTIQFLSEMNDGNLDDMVVHSDSLVTTNHNVGGAKLLISQDGIDGSYISGNFTISFGMFIVDVFLVLI